MVANRLSNSRFRYKNLQLAHAGTSSEDLRPRGLVLSTTRPTACVPGARRDPPRGDGGGGGVD